MNSPPHKDLLACIAARYDVSNDTALEWIIELAVAYEAMILGAALLGEDDERTE